MIRRIYEQLPGPSAVRIAIMIAGFIVALVLLVLVYEWLGSTLLDSGGTVE